MSYSTTNHTIPPPPPLELRPRRRPDQHSAQCPCKTLPQSLSSYTAAEYGDLHSLSRLLERNPAIAHKFDAGGYTTLHLAAQNDHAAATSLLLSSGADVDGKLKDGDNIGSDPLSNRKGCGATPLHRASFSGAVSAMRILIDWNEKKDSVTSTSFSLPQGRRNQSACSRGADLLAKDESFGDCMTPLHKAAAGGRYLAVEVLLDAFRSRDGDTVYRDGHNYSESREGDRSSILCVALTTQDAFGRTPLEVALEILPRRDEEQLYVQRWDLVAGCPADWGRCVTLLEAAEEEVRIQRQQQWKGEGRELKLAGGEKSKGGSSLSASSLPTGRHQKSTLPPVPNHLSGFNSCLDCDADGTGLCKTASWEAAFRSVLVSSVNDKLEVRHKQQPREVPAGNKNEKVSKAPEVAGPSLPSVGVLKRGTNDNSVVTSSIMPQATGNESKPESPPTTNKAVLGQKCGRCEKHCLALFRNNRGLLVCKTCRRKR